LDDQLTSNAGVDERPSLEIYDLGVIEYTKALELQRQYHKKVIEGSQGDVLLACSHEPVFTCGTSTLDEHIYRPADELERLGFSVVKVERGGSVTYHGPEQAILYPIVNLHNHRTDVGWYMRSLEETIIRTLAEYDITGIRITGKTGVWIDDNSKIAFSGVRISRWCTLHGLSLNVLPCFQQFGHVNPCGLGSIRVISMAELTQTTLTVQDVTTRLMSHFMDVFTYERHDLD
jgi:lipoate-protein ligase B